MSTADTIRAQSRKGPEDLEREIDHQRDHIAEIIRALENKLSPGELISSVMSGSKDGSREFAHNLSSTIKANPVPAVLTVAGLAWLCAGQRSPKPAPYSVDTGANESAGEHAGHLSERASELGERMSGSVGNARTRVGESMSHARTRVSDSAHGAMDSMRHGGQKAGERFSDMLETNPMAVGAMAVAVGALLGALLPSTRREDELMGHARNRVAERAREVVGKGVEQAAEAGREVTTPQQPGSDGAGTGAGASAGTHGASASTTAPPRAH